MNKRNSYLVKGILLVIFLLALITYLTRDDTIPEQKIIPLERTPPVQESGQEDTTSEIDETLKVKAYLAKKYHPGTCFGMPPCVINKEKLLATTPPHILRYLEDTFQTLNKDKLAEILTQLEQITITPYEKGYYFTIEDGQTCSVERFTGRLTTQGVNESDWIPAHVDRSTDLISC